VRGCLWPHDCLPALPVGRRGRAAQGRLLPQGQQRQKMPFQLRTDANLLCFGEHLLPGFHIQTLFCDLAGFLIDVTHTLELRASQFQQRFSSSMDTLQSLEQF
jgi:hypothetical protein